jgi:GNAT superfamily N-acetyltransferase
MALTRVVEVLSASALGEHFDRILCLKVRCFQNYDSNVWLMPEPRVRSAFLRNMWPGLLYVSISRPGARVRATVDHDDVIQGLVIETPVRCESDMRSDWPRAIWRSPRMLAYLPRLCWALLSDSTFNARLAAYMLIGKTLHVAYTRQFGAHIRLDDVCVDPSLQRQGIASALLIEVTRAADAAHTPLYLQTSSPSNVRYYRRFGFAPVCCASACRITGSDVRVEPVTDINGFYDRLGELQRERVVTVAMARPVSAETAAALQGGQQVTVDLAALHQFFLAKKRAASELSLARVGVAGLLLGGMLLACRASIWRSAA